MVTGTPLRKGCGVHGAGVPPWTRYPQLTAPDLVSVPALVASPPAELLCYIGIMSSGSTAPLKHTINSRYNTQWRISYPHQF